VVSGLHPSFNPVVSSLSVASSYKSLNFIGFQDEYSLTSFYWIAKPLPLLLIVTILPCFPPNPMPTTKTVSLKPQASVVLLLNLPPFLPNISLLHLLSLLDSHVKSVGS